jgi:Zn-dependent protease with chaperone function
MIPNYAFTTGIFGTNHVFLNASFGSWLTKDEREISIFHEMGHVTKKHNEKKTFINAVFIAAFMQAVVYVPYWYWAGVVIVIYFILKRWMNILTTPLMHLFEYEADRYAATRSGYTAKIIKWYEKLAYSRQSATHPSIYDRMHILSKHKI